MSDEVTHDAAQDAAMRWRHRDHLRLAHRLEAHPANRDGSDKTWVLDSMRRMERLFRSVVPHADPPGGAHGPLR